MRHSPAKPHRRQNAQITNLPGEPTNIPGLNGAATVTGGPGASVSLLVNGNSASDAQATAPPLVAGGGTVTISSPATSSSTPAPSPTPSTNTAASSSVSGQIPMSTVIGACVGAFLASVMLILLGVWCYKYSGRRPKRARGMSTTLDSRNVEGNNQRRRSRLEPWNKLEEKEPVDVWEGMIPASSTKEVIAYPPSVRTTTAASGTLDKLGSMFKKTPSMRSTDERSFTSHGHDDFGDRLAGSAQFAKYHPNLAEELAKTVTPMRAVLTRQDSAAISWGGDTVTGDDAYFGRINSSHLSTTSEAVSPTYVTVKSTPIATTSPLHRWESAEVMHYDESQKSQPQNPFADIDSERSSSDRKSIHNPFFNAQDSSVPKRRQSNPFADARPARSLTHTVDGSEDRMQSLLSALNISPEAVQERIRVASMHPSVISTGSAYDDDTSVADFPLPPTPLSHD